MTDIFALTHRPDPSLLFHRNEAGDPRLGEVVRSQSADYAASKVVLLGCPQDEGVKRNGGRVGAAAAPDAIRTWLYRLVAPASVQLFDLGNTIIQPTLEETHTVQQQIVRQMISDGIDYMFFYWHMAVFPTAALAITVLATTLFGDGLRDALDPTLKGR